MSPSNDSAKPDPQKAARAERARRMRDAIIERVLTARQEAETWDQCQSRRAMRLAFGTLVALVLTVILLFAEIATRPEGRFVALTPDLRVVELKPTTDPMITSSGLKNYAVDVATDALSLHFRQEHRRRTLVRVREHFKPGTFESFARSLLDSGIISTIKDKRLSSTAILTGSPVILDQRVVDGTYKWMIRFPIQVDYESSRGIEITQRLEVDLVIERVPLTEHPRGIMISKFLTRPR